MRGSKVRARESSRQKMRKRFLGTRESQKNGYDGKVKRTRDRARREKGEIGKLQRQPFDSPFEWCVFMYNRGGFYSIFFACLKMCESV